MAVCKPQDIDEYRKWLRDNHQVTTASLSRAYYESVSNKMHMTITQSTFWSAIISQLDRIGQQYYLDMEYYLFTVEFAPKLKIKPFDSFLNKTFRKNVVHNSNWPDEPEGGWLLPDNWYTRIDDIIRTLFVIKYLDGVSFLAEKLRVLLREYDLPTHVDFEAREEGYYAAHLYTECECEIPREDWTTKKIPVTIEIQITTQLQEVIRILLHKYYEDRRVKAKGSGVKWQWDYTSDEFAANYLGHILHYVEGMIMDIREKQKEVM